MYSKTFKLAVCFCFISLPLFPLVKSANILLSGIYGEGSHFLSMVPIGKSLVERGHNVTVLISDVYAHRATDPEYAQIFNFEIFTCPGHKEKMDKMFQQMGEVAFTNSTVSQVSKLFALADDFYGATCNAVLSDNSLMKRMQKIDAIAFDVSWPCAVYIEAYLSKHANITIIPLIMVSPSTPLPYVFQMAGSPLNPAYQPIVMTGLTSTMSFFERIFNTVMNIFFSLSFYKTLSKPFHVLVDEFELHPDLKNTFHHNIDLFLINSDFAVEFPFPLMPNVIAVGGLTSRPAKPLGKELEDFMQSSGDHGVVVFTLGTYFSSITSSKPEIVRVFVEALSRIPQKVLFHLKELPSYDLPPNIKVLPWLPQNDLLGHPKTRVFMYHGGNNGFQEAIYHGVPIVVIPLAGDQYDVAARVEARGLGRRIDKHRLSPEYVYEQLAEVLQNPQYNATAKRISAIFNDRPLKPADRAAFWIEHVTKHGSDYMQSPVHNLSFIQLYLIDVIAFLAVLVGITSYVSYRSVRFCICCCSCYRTVKMAKDKRE